MHGTGCIDTVHASGDACTVSRHLGTVFLAVHLLCILASKTSSVSKELLRDTQEHQQNIYCLVDVYVRNRHVDAHQNQPKLRICLWCKRNFHVKRKLPLISLKRLWIKTWTMIKKENAEMWPDQKHLRIQGLYTVSRRLDTVFLLFSAVFRCFPLKTQCRDTSPPFFQRFFDLHDFVTSRLAQNFP